MKCKYKYDKQIGYFLVYTPLDAKLPKQYSSKALSITGNPHTVSVEVVCLLLGYDEYKVDSLGNIHFNDEVIACASVSIGNIKQNGNDVKTLMFRVDCLVEL